MARANATATQQQPTLSLRQPVAPRSRSGFISIPKREERNGQAMQPQEQQTQPLTKSGYPDRRFKGQRDLPPQEEGIPYRPASKGEVINGIHYDMNGRPDLRYKENRGLTEEDIARLQLEYLQMKAGGGRR